MHANVFRVTVVGMSLILVNLAAIHYILGLWKAFKHLGQRGLCYGQGYFSFM